jgi:hypothetical protein
MAVHSASAQFQLPQGVYNSVPMYNAFGAFLPGNTDPMNSNACTVVPGSLVEILSDGSNNVAHPANPDGSPSGGDTILTNTFVGEGYYCDGVGQINTSFNGPPVGTKIYARVFDQPTVGQSSYWGQSADMTVTNAGGGGALQAMNLSALGLQATTMPLGINLSTVDSKGFTYLYELTANTNPQNAADLFETGDIVKTNNTVQVSVMGRVGREYTLQRSTNMTVWSNITSSATGMLTADTSLILSDPSPPVSPQLFYRVDVTMP